MKIEIYDYKRDIIYCMADITFGLDVFIINECNPNLEIENNPFNMEYLVSFLEKRSNFPISIETDKKILNRLGMTDKANLFGRMNEASVLYAMLNNFSAIDTEASDSIIKDTDIEVFPIKDELICMVELDQRYSNLYVWHKRRRKKKCI